MYVCVSRSEPDALWPNPSSHSFRSWLIWKVNSSSLRRCKKFCRVTWPWPIYLAPKWPPDENRVFFTMFSRFVRKRTEISKWLQWTAIRKVGMGFPTTPKSAPQLDPFPPFGGSKTWKKREKWVLPLSNDKTLLWSFSDQKLPAAKLFAHMSGRHQWKNFRNRCIITLFTLILVHPLDWRKCANFKRLYFLNGCIDLDVQYTVGKDMTRSTSWPNFIGKVYHLQGQNIGQTSENSVFGFYYACKAAVSRIYDAWSRRPPASASHCDSCATCYCLYVLCFHVLCFIFHVHVLIYAFSVQ